jgi:hypothetical protein
MRGKRGGVAHAGGRGGGDGSDGGGPGGRGSAQGSGFDGGLRKPAVVGRRSALMRGKRGGVAHAGGRGGGDGSDGGGPGGRGSAQGSGFDEGFRQPVVVGRRSALMRGKRGGVAHASGRGGSANGSGIGEEGRAGSADNKVINVTAPRHTGPRATAPTLTPVPAATATLAAPPERAGTNNTAPRQGRWRAASDEGR